MSPELEQGFGTGLRSHLQRHQGDNEPLPLALPAEQPEPEAPVMELSPPAPEPLVEQAVELATLRVELQEALAREQELRDALEHQVEAHERELAGRHELTLREAEADQLGARLAVREAELADRERTLAEREEIVVGERRDLNLRRTELVAEEARLTELGAQVEGWATSLESVDREHADASASLAKQLAGIAERERELKRAAATVDERRAEADARVAAREAAARQQEVASRQREQALAAREDELARELGRLQERVDAVATREAAVQERLGAREAELVAREADLRVRLDAREFELAGREAELSAEHDRVRSLTQRVDRERISHGRATQEAFELLAELERREEAVRQREVELAKSEAEAAQAPRRTHLVEAPKQDPQLQAREELLARGEAHVAGLRRELDDRRERAAQLEQELALAVAELEQRDEALRLHEARLAADHELRGDQLDVWSAELAERERQLADRERDLAGYVGELQGTLSARGVNAA